MKRLPLAHALLFVSVLSCSIAPTDEKRAAIGRLTARPGKPTRPCASGVQRLGLDGERDAYLFVPRSAADKPLPLLVLLHGAGGSPSRILERIRSAADTFGVVLLAPASRDATWDGIRGSPGPDVEFLNEALQSAFDRCAVDGSRLGIAGFSDGASYALTLGLINGDFFTGVIAFSPCVLSREIVARGRPRIFLSHGRLDTILPIADCGRPLASFLRDRGYPVQFKEFDGRHEVPPEIATEAFQWFAADAK